jgi:hypothetical protein
MFQLLHAPCKNRGRLFGINQKDQIIAAAQAGFQVPVRLPSQTFSVISLYGVSKAMGEGKANPIAGQLVLQHVQFCPTARYPPALVKNLPDFFLSFKMLFTPKTKRDLASKGGDTSFGGAVFYEGVDRFNRAFSRLKLSVYTGPWPCAVSALAFRPLSSSWRGTRICGSVLPCWADKSVSWYLLLSDILKKLPQNPGLAFVFLGS